MKKILITLLTILTISPAFAGCSKSIDYFTYVSENRKCVYLYKDDIYEIKIYCSDRETPYVLDGVKGNMTTVTEIYYSCKSSPSEVVCELDGHGGEMSYLAVDNCFYLSFSGETLQSQSLLVKLTIDGKESETEVFNVCQSGTITPQTAVKCVYEYDTETFSSLTNKNSFQGEISVRLIYDEGCYYYVGVCDRQKNINAYLVDGINGRIIAERQSSAE
ncbi:MAG: hypothetical protein ACI4MS_00915 [Candidatus Coproplasma sp.]